MKVSASPSRSLPVNATLFATLSGVDVDWLFATGVSFTGVTVIDTVATFESTLVSFTTNVNESGPA